MIIICEPIGEKIVAKSTPKCVEKCCVITTMKVFLMITNRSNTQNMHAKIIKLVYSPVSTLYFKSLTSAFKSVMLTVMLLECVLYSCM